MAIGKLGLRAALCPTSKLTRCTRLHGQALSSLRILILVLLVLVKRGHRDGDSGTELRFFFPVWF